MTQLATLMAAGVVGGGGAPYWTKYKSIFGSALLDHLRMNETSGVAIDASGNGINGTYVNATLANATGPKGTDKCPLFNGTNAFVNMNSITGFSGNEGTMGIWGKVANANVWTDGVVRALFGMSDLAGHYIDISKVANNTVRLEILAKNSMRTISDTGWNHYAITWSQSDNQLRFYVNAVSANPNTFTAAVAATQFLAGSLEGNQLWSGWLAHAFVLNRAATQAELAALQ